MVVVILPNTITMIGEKAFYDTNITSITIPESVQLIGEGAFAFCENISQYSVAEGNSVYATIDGVLYNKADKVLISMPMGRLMDNDEEFSIPDGITGIGAYAFAGIDFKECRLNIPSTITNIDAYAFYSSHIVDLNLNIVEQVGDYAFAGAHIQGIRGNNVTEIGDYAFSNAAIQQSPQASLVEEGLTKEYWPFPKVETIGDYAFENVLYESSEIILPSTLHSIGEGTFKHFDFPTYFTILFSSDTVMDLSATQIKTIPDYAFYSFDGSVDVYDNTVRRKESLEILLPGSVDTIGKHSFSLIGVNYRVDDDGDIDTSGSMAYEDKIALSITIPASVEKIDDSAFENSGLILDIADMSELKTIGDRAFYHAAFFNEPKELNLPEGLESIGDEAFHETFDSALLETLYIPAPVKEIGSDVCNRAHTKLKVESGSYAALYASENGYPVVNAGGEDTSWLTE